MVRPVNVVFITLDQFRGDALSCAGHPVVTTPHLDALASEGVRFARHYSQAAPCAPGRASLYTGMYQMNHRVVANGTPLDARFDTVALAARRAGYEPALFGYTDQSIDPRTVTDPDDPRLSDYEGVLPGFDHVLDLTKGHDPWIAWLRSLGHDLPAGVTASQALATEPSRPEEHSVSAFLTGEALRWIAARSEPWFVHLSYLRPHPPYAAAGRWAHRYDPADVGLPIAVADDRHPWHDVVLQVEEAAAPADEVELRRLRAQYYGMVSEVDDQLGRLWQGLRDLGAWDDTVVVVTADHGEMLGDHGLVQKLGYWEASYHIPCIVRDPRHPATAGTVVDRFTENVDVMPTICSALGVPVPVQCDGRPLTPFLDGESPRGWRGAAHWEFDWRDVLIRGGLGAWPDDRRATRLHLATLRTESHGYVQFGDGSWRCFDLAVDPTWRTEDRDPALVLPLAQEMLVWRSTHAERTLTDMLTEDGGIGRRPVGSPVHGA